MSYHLIKDIITFHAECGLRPWMVYLIRLIMAMVSGKFAGDIWTYPWKINNTDQISSGENNIQIEVSWPETLYLGFGVSF